MRMASCRGRLEIARTRRPVRYCVQVDAVLISSDRYASGSWLTYRSFGGDGGSTGAAVQAPWFFFLVGVASSLRDMPSVTLASTRRGDIQQQLEHNATLI